MTCEWAEGYLSAYLDDALDSHLQKEVSAHLESCAHCRELLEDLRRNDRILAALPPVEPASDLRSRIFDSPEFAALADELERERRGESPAPTERRSHLSPTYMRAVIASASMAALLAVSLGGALLYQQGRLPFGGATTAQHQTTTIAGPGAFNAPLSAGSRLVYLSGGALWSAAEVGPSSSGAPGTPQRLTPAGVQVIAWRVSPLTAPRSGVRIAYVDGQTGTLHIIHSDSQADTVVDSLAPTHNPNAAFWASDAGRATLASLTWSPDGSRLAYTVLNGARTEVRIVTEATDQASSILSLAEISNAQGGTQPANLSALTWRPDGQALALVETHEQPTAGPAQSVVVWGGVGAATTAYTADAGAHAATSSVQALGWSGSTLTWSVGAADAISGVYRLASGDSAPALLTPNGATYSAAAFTPAHGGEWLLGQSGALLRLRLAGGAPVAVASTAGPVSQIVWSPDGARAVAQATNQLLLWSASGGTATLGAAGGARPAPTWAPDSAQVAVATGQGIEVFSVNGAPVSHQVAPTTGSVTALAWAPSGHDLAVADSGGVRLVSLANGQAAILTTQPVATLLWSVAG